MSGTSGFSKETSWDTEKRRTVTKYSLSGSGLGSGGNIQNTRNGTSTFVDICMLSHR